MRTLRNILLFQRDILLISYSISISIGLLVRFEPMLIGLNFMLIAPISHFFLYEIRNKNYYYYFYNLGLSKTILWCSTFIIGIINLLIISIVC